MTVREIWGRDRAACVFLAFALVAATLYGGGKPPAPATPTPWGRMLCAAVSRDASWLVRPLQHFKPLLTKETQQNEE